MYGDTNDLYSTPVNFGSAKLDNMYNNFLNNHHQIDKLDLVPKLLRNNVAPIAALLVFYVVFLKLFVPFVAKPVLSVLGCVWFM